MKTPEEEEEGEEGPAPMCVWIKTSDRRRRGTISGILRASWQQVNNPRSDREEEREADAFMKSARKEEEEEGKRF